MKNLLTVAAAQFQHQDGDKAANLARIDNLTAQAADAQADVVSFHECCITGYTFLQSLSRQQLLEIAEPIPGPSVLTLQKLAAEYKMILLAGLLEREDDKVFNSYVCVDGHQVLAKHRKLHAFINPHVSCGDAFTVFDLPGPTGPVRCGILICYDNNLPENVRITTLKGAQLIFMPHVTGCTASPMPGRGTVDPQLWSDRHHDPVPLRQQFNGPKHRAWLLRWLPTRAFENGVYVVFTNPIGMDGGEVRGGGSLVLDPYGEILSECTRLDDQVVVACCTQKKLDLASGRRYLRARRPELYGQLVEPSAEPPQTLPGWKLHKPSDAR